MERCDTEGMREYLEAVGKRFVEDADIYKRFAELKNIISSASHHLQRFDISLRRHSLAKTSSDVVAQQYEKDVMNILLYEALDHVFMAFSKLDLESLGLRMPIAGHGLTGEYAQEVLTIMDLLEGLSSETLAREKRYGLNLDFSRCAHEKEGITYGLQSHWGTGDFRAYFTQARCVVSEKLHKKPAFWSGKTTADFLRRRGYNNLLGALLRLDSLSMKGAAGLRAA